MTTFGYDSLLLLSGNQTGKADGRYEGEYINELRSWSAIHLPIGFANLPLQPHCSNLSFLLNSLIYLFCISILPDGRSLCLPPGGRNR